MNTSEKRFLRFYSDQPKSMSISCLQGNTGAFLFHGSLSRNHIHVSVTAIFLVFLKNYTTFLESPIGQFVCSLVNPFGFLYHPSISISLWGSLGICSKGSMVAFSAEPASVSRPFNAFTSVFCNLQKAAKS